MKRVAEESNESEQSEYDDSSCYINGKNEFPIEIPRVEAIGTIDDIKITPDLDQV